MTNPNAVYARFEDLEEQLAHCYFTLHERFAADPELAAFWADAAWEELQRSSILRYCREQALRADATVNMNTANNVADLLAAVKRIVQNPGVTVDEAFYASLLMESSELDDAFEKLTRPLARHHRALFEAIHARTDKRLWKRTAS